MLPTTLLLLSLSLLGVTAALPSLITPSESSMVLTTPSESNSLSILAARGIDPAGPIPADAIPLGNGGYSFSADSDTAHWVRAQEATPLSKRANSGLSVTFWGGAFCEGDGAFFPNVQYGVSCLGPHDFYGTVQFLGRAILVSERMDLFRLVGNSSDKCGGFVQSLGGFAGPGCYQLKFRQFSCMRLEQV